MQPKFAPSCSGRALPAPIACSARLIPCAGRLAGLPTTLDLVTFHISTAAFGGSTAPRLWMSGKPLRRPVGEVLKICSIRYRHLTITSSDQLPSPLDSIETGL